MIQTFVQRMLCDDVAIVLRQVGHLKVGGAGPGLYELDILNSKLLRNLQGVRGFGVDGEEAGKVRG